MAAAAGGLTASAAWAAPTTSRCRGAVLLLGCGCLSMPPAARTARCRSLLPAHCMSQSALLSAPVGIWGSITWSFEFSEGQQAAPDCSAICENTGDGSFAAVLQTHNCPTKVDAAEPQQVPWLPVQPTVCRCSLLTALCHAGLCCQYAGSHHMSTRGSASHCAAPDCNVAWNKPRQSKGMLQSCRTISIGFRQSVADRKLTAALQDPDHFLLCGHPAFWTFRFDMSMCCRCRAPYLSSLQNLCAKACMMWLFRKAPQQQSSSICA